MAGFGVHSLYSHVRSELPSYTQRIATASHTLATRTLFCSRFASELGEEWFGTLNDPDDTGFTIVFSVRQKYEPGMDKIKSSIVSMAQGNVGISRATWALADSGRPWRDSPEKCAQKRIGLLRTPGRARAYRVARAEQWDYGLLVAHVCTIVEAVIVMIDRCVWLRGI